MARLNWTGWCGIAGVAVVVTLFALPSTGWICVENGRAATGSMRSMMSFDDYLRAYSRVDKILEPYVYPNPSTAGEELYNTIAKTDYEEEGKGLDALSDRYPNDPLVQAELVRWASRIGVPRMDNDPRNGNPTAQKPSPQTLRMIALLAKAAARGEKADPDNAHFALMTAAAHWAKGEEAQAEADFERAAVMPKYNDYTVEYCDLVNGRLRQAGDRGNYRQVIVCASVMLPYITHERAAAKRAVASGTGARNIASRMRVMKLADTMARYSDTLIGMLIAISSAKVAVMQPGFESLSTGRRPHARVLARECREHAQALQTNAVKAGVAIPGFDAGTAMQTLLADEWAYRTVVQPKIEDTPYEPLPGLVPSTLLLLAFILAAPLALAFGLGQSWREHEGAGLALPLLVPLVAAFIRVNGPWSSVGSLEMAGAAQVIVLIGAFAFAWWPRLRPAVPWLVWLVVVGGVVGTIGRDLTEFPAENVISLSLLMSWVLSRPRMPVWLSWTLASLQLVVLALAVAAVAMWVVANSTVAGLIGFAILAALLAASFGPRTRIPIRAAVGPCLLVCALAYGVSVRRQVAADHDMARFVRSFLEEADLARKTAPSIDVDKLEKESTDQLRYRGNAPQTAN
jgi:hypothetical protein